MLNLRNLLAVITKTSLSFKKRAKKIPAPLAGRQRKVGLTLIVEMLLRFKLFFITEIPRFALNEEKQIDLTLQETSCYFLPETGSD